MAKLKTKTATQACRDSLRMSSNGRRSEFPDFPLLFGSPACVLDEDEAIVRVYVDGSHAVHANRYGKLTLSMSCRLF